MSKFGEDSMSLESQKKLIKERNWDCLLVLDACRFDFFKKVYNDFFTGDLQRVKSAGSRTEDWLKNTFDGGNYKDVIYVSGNPHINSVISNDKFTGKELFSEIRDVWDWGWDEKSGTVHPKAVRGETVKVSQNTDKRIIAHFMQPHWPYLTVSVEKVRDLSSYSSESDFSFFPNPKEFISFFGKDNWVTIGKIIRKVLGWKRAYRFAQRIGLTNARDIKLFGERYGDDKLRAEYEKNLRETLNEISILVEKIDGNIVVTSDHGEFLGEEGFYGHHFRCDDPILKMVPWLEIFNN